MKFQKKIYTDRHYETKHIEIIVHKQKKLFECTLCNIKFGQKPSLNKHIALQHSMMVKRHLVVKYVKISLHVKNI